MFGIDLNITMTHAASDLRRRPRRLMLVCLTKMAAKKRMTRIRRAQSKRSLRNWKEKRWSNKPISRAALTLPSEVPHAPKHISEARNELYPKQEEMVYEAMCPKNQEKGRNDLDSEIVV